MLFMLARAFVSSLPAVTPSLVSLSALVPMNAPAPASPVPVLAPSFATLADLTHTAPCLIPVPKADIMLSTPIPVPAPAPPAPVLASTLGPAAAS